MRQYLELIYYLILTNVLPRKENYKLVSTDAKVLNKILAMEKLKVHLNNL